MIEYLYKIKKANANTKYEIIVSIFVNTRLAPKPIKPESTNISELPKTAATANP